MNITVTHTLAPEIIELLKNIGSATEKIASHEQVKEATPVKDMKPKKSAVKTETKEETKEETTPASFEDIRLIVQQKAQAGKRDEVKKLLTEFGADKVSALEKEQYQEFFTKVNAL